MWITITRLLNLTNFDAFNVILQAWTIDMWKSLRWKMIFLLFLWDVLCCQFFECTKEENECIRCDNICEKYSKNNQCDFLIVIFQIWHSYFKNYSVECRYWKVLYILYKKKNKVVFQKQTLAKVVEQNWTYLNFFSLAISVA